MRARYGIRGVAVKYVVFQSLERIEIKWTEIVHYELVAKFIQVCNPVQVRS